MTAVDLIARIETTAESFAPVVQLLRAYGDVVRAEPGNLRFELFAIDDPQRRLTVVVIERYVDEAAFQAHLRAPENAEVNRALAAALGGGGSQLDMLVPLD